MNEHYTKQKSWSLPGHKSVALEKYDKLGKIKGFSDNNLLASNYSTAVWWTSLSYSPNKL